MVLVVRQPICLSLEVEGMVVLGNPIFELSWNIGLILKLLVNEETELLEQVEGNEVRVYRIGLIEEVQTLLLLQCAQNELLLLGVAVEEGFTQEGQVNLAGRCYEVEDTAHEHPRSHLLVQHQ